MAKVELVMPKMGESIMEATILKWHKQVGDQVEMDETILEIATDKVDTEIPAPMAGTVLEILHQVDEVVEVGKIIAIIGTEATADTTPSPTIKEAPAAVNGHAAKSTNPSPKATPATTSTSTTPVKTVSTNHANNGTRFYSPLVKNIAKEENVAMAELESINGSGKDGRVTKKDMLQYLENRQQSTHQTAAPTSISAPVAHSNGAANIQSGGDTEIIEMDRMPRLIADHMVNSKHTSPHVTSFVEADVTNLVNWRNRVKGPFQKKYGEKITFTPIFVEAVAKAIGDFPMINVSVNGNQIIRKKSINVGMATALPSGNLIVPVIKNANRLNLLGLAQSVNDLANRARNNKLKPEDVQDGTFTLTNVGTFGNVMGTPIINQPQVAIMAAGAIRKKPAVMETEYGDVIAIRQMMFLSLSYDHRVVDGFLGGSFLRKVADYLEGFDDQQTI